MRGLRLRYLSVLGVFFAFVGHVFAECPEITGTFLCVGGTSDLNVTTTTNDEGQYVYALSHTDPETQKRVVKSYIADGVPRVVDSLKRMSVCSNGFLKVVYTRPEGGESQQDSTAVFVRNYSISGEGNFTGATYIGYMEHENLESLKILKQRDIFYCYRR